jgi:hypothetical protein
MNEIMAAPFPPEKEAAARDFLERMEAHRKASMAQYEKDGMPPFARSSMTAIEGNLDTNSA